MRNQIHSAENGYNNLVSGNDRYEESISESQFPVGGQPIERENNIRDRDMENVPINTIRDINIKPLNHGFVVGVGCQTFAIESIDKLCRNLKLYLSNPGEYEKQWLKTKELQ